MRKEGSVSSVEISYRVKRVFSYSYSYWNRFETHKLETLRWWVTPCELTAYVSSAHYGPLGTGNPISYSKDATIFLYGGFRLPEHDEIHRYITLSRVHKTPLHFTAFLAPRRLLFFYPITYKTLTWRLGSTAHHFKHS